MNKPTHTLTGWTAKPMDIRIGLDLSDKLSHWAATDTATGELRLGTVQTTQEAVRETFSGMAAAIVVVEAGSHSYWVARTLNECGHRALVVDPAILRQGKGKRRRRNDKKDALSLMEVAIDVDRPRANAREIWQRPLEAQQNCGLVRARDAAVRERSRLVSTVRGIVKPYGVRIGSHSVEAFPRAAREELPANILKIVEPLLCQIESGTETVRTYDRMVKEFLDQDQDAQYLLQISGVGPITTAVFLATVADPQRFAHSRDVAAYLGLVPGVDQSGEDDPQLRIQKTGDALCRRVLVQCAHHIISLGPDTDLQRWGRKLRGEGKNKTRAKQAAIAVARKLATLLHRLWITRATYKPLLGSPSAEVAA